MKKLLSILTALAMVLTLCACTQTPPETFPTTTVPETTVQTEPTQPPAVFADYEYRYEEGRDRKWEEDIVYMAKCYLGEMVPSSRHPKLVNREIMTYNFTGGANTIYEAYYYDEAIRTAFCEAIQELLPRIPELRDEEILFEMNKAVALLGDIHSSIVVPDQQYFPLLVEPLEAEDGMGLYVTRITKEYEEAAFAKLLAVNGVPVEEIARKLLPAVTHENPYYAFATMFHPAERNLFYTLWAMQVTGVVPWDEQEADFTLLTRSGEEMTVSLTAKTAEERKDIQWSLHSFYDLKIGYYLNRIKDIYRWEYFDEENTLYIRFNRISVEPGCPMNAFVKELQKQVTSETEKVIVDFRGNPGGFYEKIEREFLPFMESLDGPQVYVLTDCVTASSALSLAAVIRQNVAGCKIVGTPAGQPTHFFAKPTSAETPNFAVSFSISKDAITCWDDYEGDALMPDIPVHQTLEDYINGVDTVLEAVLSGNCQPRIP